MGWLMSLEHFPGAIPEPRPWPGRGAVKGVSPGGAGHPITRVYRKHEDGVWTCERPAPEGCSAPLTAGSPPRPTLSGGMAPGSELHPVIRCRVLMLGRAIPTDVGTTPVQVLAVCLSPGHPHGCGDYASWKRKRFLLRRVIPTGVGTTAGLGRGSLSPQGHPHGCGDYAGRIYHAGATQGAIPTDVGTTLDQDGKNTSSLPVMCLFGRWCR
jgi:hypothetical protein